MAKARVYELAKDLGVSHTVIMATLQELGEFVRSASSTVEPAVVRKLRAVIQERDQASTGSTTMTSPDVTDSTIAPEIKDAPSIGRSNPPPFGQNGGQPPSTQTKPSVSADGRPTAMANDSLGRSVPPEGREKVVEK